MPWKNCAASGVIMLALATGLSAQTRESAPRVNLGQLASTIVSASSVNGKREQKNQYYGLQNLFDGGRHIIDGINYTTWLSDQDAAHWIRMSFRDPVTIQSIMLELTTLDSRSASIVAESDPTVARVPTRRPQEMALDIAYSQNGQTRTDKQPSIALKGFRVFYPLDKPLENVVALTLVFPGPSMIEVSEIEVLGTTGR